MVEWISILLPEHPLAPKMDLAMISAVAMKPLSHKAGSHLIALFLYKINQAIWAEATKNDWK